MRVALGADDPCALLDAIRQHLEAAGHEVVEPIAVGSVWTDVGAAIGRSVAEGSAEIGVVVCWTGTGVSIAANKVPGVRAALCADAETATGSRRWNDANVLALSQRLTTPAVGEEILDAFLAGRPDDDERPTIARLP